MSWGKRRKDRAEDSLKDGQKGVTFEVETREREEGERREEGDKNSRED